MNRRPRILTRSVLASIPALIEQGLHRAEIAERLGCKLSTLQVRCSKAGISLRGRNRLELGNGTPLSLSRPTVASLKARAVVNGCTEAQLASILIETIARDDLYDAVLDSAPPLSPQLDPARLEPAAKVR
jgi:hypothetical protein